MGRVFNGSADIIEITIKDPSGKRIEKYVSNLQDKEQCEHNLKHICKKYDLDLKNVQVDIDIKPWYEEDELIKF